MNVAEFNWWLLIVGLVVGAGLTWLVLADGRRREEDLLEAELATEADWIATNLAADGRRTDAATVLEMLRLHRAWLAGPPPDDAPADDPV